MSAAVCLRANFAADDLRQRAKLSRNADQSQQALELVTISDGGSRTDAARTGAVDLQTVRN